MSSSSRPQNQQDFLTAAMETLGLDRCQMCERMNASRPTFDRWMQASESMDFRELPPYVWAHVREIIQHDLSKDHP